jgi:hypothetical protein
MRPAEIRLSVNELAFVLLQVGQPEAACQLIQSQSEKPLSEEEFHTRLTSAAHALLARDWVFIAGDGCIRIKAPLQHIVNVLAQADFSIRYSYVTHDNQEFLTYHFHHNHIIEHLVEGEIIHSLLALRQVDQVFAGGIAFFDVAGSELFNMPPLELSSELVNELIDESDMTIAAQRLRQAGFTEDAGTLVAQDIVEPIYRGSIVRVAYGENGEMLAERSLFLLRGPERLWLLRPSASGDESLTTMVPCTEQVFRESIAALIAPAS